MVQTSSRCKFAKMFWARDGKKNPNNEIFRMFFLRQIRRIKRHLNWLFWFLNGLHLPKYSRMGNKLSAFHLMLGGRLVLAREDRRTRLFVLSGYWVTNVWAITPPNDSPWREILWTILTWSCEFCTKCRNYFPILHNSLYLLLQEMIKGKENSNLN